MQIVEDLHVARVKKKMALPVIQTCGELTSMEIDLPEPDLNISAGMSCFDVLCCLCALSCDSQLMV